MSHLDPIVKWNIPLICFSLRINSYLLSQYIVGRLYVRPLHTSVPWLIFRRYSRYANVLMASLNGRNRRQHLESSTSRTTSGSTASRFQTTSNGHTTGATPRGYTTTGTSTSFNLTAISSMGPDSIEEQQLGSQDQDSTQTKPQDIVVAVDKEVRSESFSRKHHMRGGFYGS